MEDKFTPPMIDQIRNAKKCAISTGAGISAESGMPTFRDAQTGLWATYDPHQLATKQGFQNNPKLVWEWYAYRRNIVNTNKPNAGHIALVEMEALFPTFALITQNIDGYHKLAGSRDIIELHGNIQRFRCFQENTIIDSWPQTDNVPPKCPNCGAYIRPDVVWFYESLNPMHVLGAQSAAELADVFISIGTSGVVYPAALLPSIAKAGGALTIEVNLELTPQSEYADVILPGKSGDVLPQLVQLFKRWRAEPCEGFSA